MIDLHHSDCIEWLRAYDGPLFDSCVTDPPYHLSSIVKRFGFNGSDQFTDRSSYTRVIWRSLLEVEHAVPLHNGGSNELDNLRLLCRNCHRSKTTVEHSARLRRLFAEARV